MMSAASVPSVAAREALSSSYEELRLIALGGQGRGVGLAFFIRCGMARWIDTCIAMLTQPAPAPRPTHPDEQPHVPADLCVEVAMVLAEMALSAHAQGATTC